ncbi:TetR/AcrR family transcriptional regulator [Pseudoduganella namucuonensis]|uniref:Transcriptional regulator, TetR family n=1 Tax=Pseudoduganella namucuonensis TaxID=1035707 RepID=A0A1I7LMY0_9BURK|nr:TetR/AcrR family transcriptional regulator [Pseudoduganella namucuonensis]SFV11041.1 transcriptional regulator, TetR family [Pseudoduganella namucuonensis]
MTTEDTPNHRTRVAAERRGKTRAKLLESALLVFAQKGAGAVIDDVIAHAGMARGSFYNYFRTNEELLAAVADEINDELLRAIDPVVLRCDDPAERIACGTRLLLHTVRRFPLYGGFMARLPFPAANSGLLGARFLARDVRLGVATRRFADIGWRVGADMLVGVMLSAACSTAREPLSPAYPDASARAMLRALGLDEVEAARLTALPLPAFELPPSSLLRRAQLLSVGRD